MEANTTTSTSSTKKKSHSRNVSSSSYGKIAGRSLLQLFEHTGIVNTNRNSDSNPSNSSTLRLKKETRTTSSPKFSRILSSSSSNDGIFNTTKRLPFELVRPIDDQKRQLAIDEDLDSLLNLLEFDQVETRYLAAEVIQGLQVSNEGVQLTDGSWRALAILTKRFIEEEKDNENGLKEITWTLATLSSHFNCQRDLVTNIEWATLLRLANCDQVEIKSNICTLLGYLSLNDQYSRVILKHFLDLLTFSGKLTRHTKVKSAVATTLANLSLNDENAKQICDKALELLILWIMDSQDQKQLRGAVNTITNIILVGDEKRIRTFLEKNGLVPLTKLLRSQDVYVLKSVTLAISTIATLHDQHLKMIKLGIIDQLVFMAKNSNLEEGIIIAIAHTFHNMAKNEECRRDLHNRGVHSVLASFSSKTSNDSILAEIRLTSAWLNESLSKSYDAEEFENPLLTNDSTLNSGQHSRSSSISSQGSDGLNLSRSGSFGANFAQYWKVRRSSSASEGSPKIPSPIDLSNEIDITSDTYYPGVMADLVYALEANPELASTFVKREHLDKFREIAKFNVSKQIQLAHDPKHDILPNLVLILFSNDDHLKSLALDVITLFADNNEMNQKKIITSQGLRIVMDLVFLPPSISTSGISIKAVNALASLCSNNRAAALEIREAGIVAKLVDMVKSTNIQHQKNAAAAICSFCEVDADNQEYVLKLGGIPFIVNLLHTSNPDVVKAVGAATLTALVKCNSKVQQFLLSQKNFVSTVVKFLESKDLDVKVHLCALIMEFCRDHEKGQKAMWAEGVAEPLLSILQSVDIHQGQLVYHCTGAIWILSKKKKQRKFFVKNGALTALNSLMAGIATVQIPKIQVHKAVEQTLILLSKDVKKSKLNG